jgi:hypothetical protein
MGDMIEVRDRKVREKFLNELRCILTDALRGWDSTGSTTTDALTQDKILQIITPFLTSKSAPSK